ncbi:hypothetical protein HID58_048510 [Brassica napus]|uniref:F-box domain-containing protein n=1 Tax=Brassica napus TaxID=3708 RepID=A0ABQ8B368_BRANA|nr:hypothetical protein HID58_048510 [Brassica napus]
MSQPQNPILTTPWLLLSSILKFLSISDSKLCKSLVNSL